MKRYLSMFLMIVIVMLLQTTIFPHIRLVGVTPNLFVVLTAASGFMYGRKFGMFTGFFCGFFMDFIYRDVIGISIAIFVIVGYINGIANKLYFEDDLSIPLASIALSDLLYGLLYYVCQFMMRGRFHIWTYMTDIMIPEAIYTIIIGIFVYKFMHWLEEKLYPPKEVPIHTEDKLIT